MVRREADTQGLPNQIHEKNGQFRGTCSLHLQTGNCINFEFDLPQRGILAPFTPNGSTNSHREPITGCYPLFIARNIQHPTKRNELEDVLVAAVNIGLGYNPVWQMRFFYQSALTTEVWEKAEQIDSYMGRELKSH